jgi:hypothetical protein
VESNGWNSSLKIREERIMAEERIEKVVEFIEGVVFKFNGNFKNIGVEKIEPESNEKLPDPTNEFEPKRWVLKFRLYLLDDPTKTVTNFNGTIHLTVYFLKEDHDFAVNLDNLDLGLYDYDKSKWVSFKKKESLAKQNDKTKKPWKGYGKVIIRNEFPDPVMAWGK